MIHSCRFINSSFPSLPVEKVRSPGQSPSPSSSPSPASTPASSVTQSEFRCDLCSRDFSSERALQGHRATSKAHKKQPVDLRPETNPQVPDDKPKAGFSRKDPRWSEILPGEHQQIQKALSGMCHSLTDLASKKFLLHGEYSSPSRYLDESEDTPAPVEPRSKRAAVALDCEMVGANGHQECISLTAVDFMTGEVLIHSLVDPLFPVTAWRTQHSGVCLRDLKRAKREGRVLHGFVGARAELYKHIDSRTILVGHALDNDLCVLRMAHYSIVDSEIVARNAIAVKGNQWGLKALSEEFPKIEIQRTGEAHDSREDALAAREVVLCFVRRPKELEEWADKKRQVIIQGQKGTAAKKKAKSRYPASYFNEDGW